MNPTTSAAAKVCVVCGQDCSTKPRTKDPQGRYTCKECFDRLAAKRAPAPAAKPATAKPSARPAAPPQPRQFEEAPDDAAVMAGLMKDVPVSTENCPSCGAGLLPGASVCTICGYNKETGKTLGVKTLRAPKEKRSGPGAAEILLNPGYTALAAIVVLGGLFALAFVNPLGAALYILAAFLYFMVFSVVMLIDAFRQSVGTGLCYLLVPFYAIYYVLARCESVFIKTHFFLSFLAALGSLALVPMMEGAMAAEGL